MAVAADAQLPPSLHPVAAATHRPAAQVLALLRAIVVGKKTIPSGSTALQSSSTRLREDPRSPRQIAESCQDLTTETR